MICERLTALTAVRASSTSSNYLGPQARRIARNIAKLPARASDKMSGGTI
jgi:hypothetical protein